MFPITFERRHQRPQNVITHRPDCVGRKFRIIDLVWKPQKRSKVAHKPKINKHRRHLTSHTSVQRQLCVNNFGNNIPKNSHWFTYVHLDAISRSLLAIFVVCRNSIKCGGRSLKHSSTMRWVSPHLLSSPVAVSLLLREAARRDSVSFCEFTDETRGINSSNNANILYSRRAKIL